MEKIRLWIKHNPSQSIFLVVVIATSFWFYGCESKVTSLNGSPQKITRDQLQIEINNFAKNAEIKISQLNKQDDFKRMLAENALAISRGGDVSVFGVAQLLIGLFGGAAIIDNRKKKTVIGMQKMALDAVARLGNIANDGKDPAKNN